MKTWIIAALLAGVASAQAEPRDPFGPRPLVAVRPCPLASSLIEIVGLVQTPGRWGLKWCHRDPSLAKAHPLLSPSECGNGSRGTSSIFPASCVGKRTDHGVEPPASPPTGSSTQRGRAVCAGGPSFFAPDHLRLTA